MSNPTVQNPIPKRIQVMNTYGAPPDNESVTADCPSLNLEEIVNDCFELSMNMLEDEKKVYIAQKFEDMVLRSHCGENLNFLLDIFKYEFYLNKIVPSESGTRERLNSVSGSTLLLQIRGGEFPLVGISSRSRTSSFRSQGLRPIFGSSNDDLGSFKGEGNIQSAWDGLGEKIIDSDDDILVDLISISDIDMDTLTNQWNHIINHYIIHDSCEEINLSDKVYNAIIEEHRNVGIHDVNVLLAAKKEVLRLLRENVFHRFVNQEKKLANGSPLCCCQSIPCQAALSIKNSEPSSFTDSPAISSSSLTSKKDKSYNLDRKLHTSTPGGISDNNDDSSSFNTSSLTNLLGHLKLNSSAPPSNLHSLSNSPQEEKTYTVKFARIWKKKKHFSNQKE